MCAVALGLVLLDGIADAAGCPDSKAAATACHACSCGPHMLSPGVIEVVPISAPAPYAAFEPSPYAFLLPESIFRPPSLAA